MPDTKDYSGMAALSICEALLLALNERKLLPESETQGILQDAAATHERAAEIDSDGETHLAVAELINRIIAGKEPARRS